MSVNARRSTPSSGKSLSMLGCRRETSTQRSQRSRKIKRLQQRLVAVFVVDPSRNTAVEPADHYDGAAVSSAARSSSALIRL
jgi:hypothetical protein